MHYTLKRESDNPDIGNDKNFSDVFEEATSRAGAAGAPARARRRRGGSTAPGALDSVEGFRGVSSNTPHPILQVSPPESFNGLGSNFLEPSKVVDISAFSGFDGGARLSLVGSWESVAWRDFSRRASSWLLDHQAAHDLRPEIVKPCPERPTFKMMFRGSSASERAAFGRQNAGLIWCLIRGGVRLFINADLDEAVLANGSTEFRPKDGRIAVGVVFDERAFRGGRSLFAVGQSVLEFLALLGFRLDDGGEKLSRLDIQVTTDRFEVGDVRRAWHEGRIVSRVALDKDFKGHEGSERGGTLYFGKRSAKVNFRIYDKMADLWEKNLEDEGDKLRYYINALGLDWVDSGRPLTRFEFQINREFLHENGIDSLADLSEKLPGIVNYLIGDYFRILDVPKDAKNSARQPSGEHWAAVSGEFERFFSSENLKLDPSSDEYVVTRNKKVREEDELPDFSYALDLWIHATALLLNSIGVKSVKNRRTIADLFGLISPVLRLARDKIEAKLQGREAINVSWKSFVDFRDIPVDKVKNSLRITVNDK